MKESSFCRLWASQTARKFLSQLHDPSCSGLPAGIQLRAVVSPTLGCTGQNNQWLHFPNTCLSQVRQLFYGRYIPGSYNKMSEQFRKIPQKQGFPGQIKLLPFPLCHRHSRQFRCLCTEWRCVINYSFLPFSISRAPLSRSNRSPLSLNSIHWFPAHVRSFSTGCLFQNFSKEQLHLLTSIKSFGFCYYSRIKSVLTENFFPPTQLFLITLGRCRKKTGSITDDTPCQVIWASQNRFLWAEFRLISQKALYSALPIPHLPKWHRSYTPACPPLHQDSQEAQIAPTSEGRTFFQTGRSNFFTKQVPTHPCWLWEKAGICHESCCLQTIPKARASWSFITLQDGAFVKLRNILFMRGKKNKRLEKNTFLSI